MEQKKILVAGATGNQGGSIARALLHQGHKVTGITRNVNSPKAEALKSLGADLESVSFLDQKKLTEIMTEVDTVFAMTTPFEGGMEDEIEKYLVTRNIPYTIVGPSYFMDNLFFPFNIDSPRSKLRGIID